MSNAAQMSLAERRMSQMAEKNGADLDLAMQSGHLIPEDYVAAAQSCTGCACGNACDQFLREDETGFPSYCRNADLLRRLAGL
ncbi:MAG: DUF6455 family protein [Pseudomonadota bacterium]